MAVILDQSPDILRLSDPWRFPHTTVTHEDAINAKKKRYGKMVQMSHTRDAQGKINAHATLVAAKMRRDLYASGDLDDEENHQIVQEARKLAKEDMEARR